MLSAKQLAFIDSAKLGRNIFLTGKAGTGKSFVLKKFREEHADSRHTMVLAPTGVAANNAGGQTIHSAFQLPPFGVLDFEACRYWKGDRRNIMKAVKTFIIDEVSMIRPDILDAMHWSLIKNGCGALYERQIIFVGDMKQLPPVIDDNSSSVLLRDYSECNIFAAKCFSKLEIETIELDECQRQSDPEFIAALNIVRDGGKSEYFRQFTNASNDGVVLAPYNATVNEYNIRGLHSQPGEIFTYRAEVEGTAKVQDFALEGEINVRDGCKIMYLVNSKDNNLFNGAIGTFRMIKDIPCIEVGVNIYPLERVTQSKKAYVLNDQNELELVDVGSITQYPIKLAYAITIHKSQGLTFDEMTLDLTRPCFQSGQMYVALSRVRTPEGLAIKIK